MHRPETSLSQRLDRTLVQRSRKVCVLDTDNAGSVASCLLPPGLQTILSAETSIVTMDDDDFADMKTELLKEPVESRDVLRSRLYNLFGAVAERALHHQLTLKTMSGVVVAYEQLSATVEQQAARVAELRDNHTGAALCARAMACYALGEIRGDTYDSRTLRSSSLDLFHAKPL